MEQVYYVIKYLAEHGWSITKDIAEAIAKEYGYDKPKYTATTGTLFRLCNDGIVEYQEQELLNSKTMKFWRLKQN